MANKELSVIVTANTQQLDEARKKLGELKDFGKGLQVQYDIDGKPIDVVLDKTLNLSQQVKVLTAELRRTKEGTAEFNLFNSKLKESQDALARVNQKNKDLFATFSLIPGPIGDIFGKLNGVIGLLKTFSGFTIKDFGNQFKELGKDIAGIYDAIFGVNKAFENSTNAINDNASSIQTNTTDIQQNTEAQDANVDATDEGTAATNAGTVANQKQTDAIKKSTQTQLEYFNIVKRGGIAVLEAKQSLSSLTEEQYNEAVAEQKALSKKRDSVFVTEEFIKAKEGEKFVINETTNSLEVYKGGLIATDAAAKAVIATTNALNIALKAIGIGLLIGAVTAIADKIITWAKSIGETSEATKKLTEATQKGNEALFQAKNNVDQVGIAFNLARKGTISKKEALDQYNKILGSTIGQAKTFGEAEDLYNKNTANYIKATGLRAEAQALYAIAASKSAEATVAVQRGFFSFERGLFQSFEKELAQRKDKLITDANTLKSKADELIAAALPLESGFKPKEDTKTDTKGEDLAKQKIEDAKTANETLLELQKENTLASLKNERDRQYKELELQAATEVDKINALKISEDKKEEIRNQIFLKYAKKQIALKEKFDKEDMDKAKELAEKKIAYEEKLEQFRINAIEDATQKEKEERQKKYDDELKDLNKALKDKLVSQSQYDTALRNLKISLDNDLKKIDDDKDAKDLEAKQKKLDDDIRILEIQVEAEKNTFSAYWDDRQKLLDAAKERELLETDISEAKKIAIEKKYVQLSKDLQKEKFNATLGFINAGLAAFSNALGQQQQINQLAQENELQAAEGNATKQDEIKKKYFEKNKNTQIAQAIIGTLQGAVQAYQSLAVIPIVGPALGAIAAAAALVFGYKQVALIKAQQYQGAGAGAQGGAAGPQANFGKNYGNGGMIEGPRHSSKEGGVPIMAEGGEAVMTRGAVTMFKPLLSLMNQAGGGTAFVPNMRTTSFDMPKTSNPAEENKPTIVKSYVVSSELTNEQQRQARLKDLSTL